MLSKEQIQAYLSMDRLGVIYGKNESAAGLFVLGAELYVEPRERAQLRLDMLDVQEDYYKRFNADLDGMRYNTFTDTEPGSKKVKLKNGENPFPWVRQIIGYPKKHDAYCNILYQGEFTHPDFPNKKKFQITPWLSTFLVIREAEKELSYYASSIPVSDGKAKLHFDVWRECILTWAKRLRPAHGLAGLTIVMADDTIDGPFILPTIKEYPGLDVQVPINFSMCVEQVFNRIKCVNWLTVLGDKIVEELGGLSILRDELESDCTLYPYPGGVLIQAGEAPHLADVEVPGSSELLEPYRKVARITKRVRFKDYNWHLIQLDESFNEIEEAKKWVSRFD